MIILCYGQCFKVSPGSGTVSPGTAGVLTSIIPQK